jgi:DNA-binding PadR family transcriptional regulator
VPIQHAVLALLSDGESYGYELRAEFERAVGPQWGQLNIGHLYQILDRLVRDGLVTKREVEQRRLPDRVVYRLTSAGKQELNHWLEMPFVRQAGYRDDFFLKLLAASRLGRERLDLVIRTQREAYLGELSALSELRSSHEAEPLVSLLIEAAILHTEANLRTIEQAEQRAERLAALASTPTERQPAARADGSAGAKAASS